jgi:hypothetical protein
VVALGLPGSIVLRVVRPVVRARRGREVWASLLRVRHVSAVAVLTVQVAAAPVVPASTQAPTSTPSRALWSSAAVLLPVVALALRVVGAVVVGAVLRVVRGAAVALRAASAGSLLAAVALSVLLVAVVLDLLLLGGGEEAAGDLLEKLVGNLLGAVTDGLECEN